MDNYLNRARALERYEWCIIWAVHRSQTLSIDLSSYSFAKYADDSKLPLSLATYGLEFYKDSTIMILWLLGLPSKWASN